ncbi:MAG: hypothetical protein IPJ66_17610 [Bacteroidetes bacterium]|nr:hypothetical protein [Bacteroidota bacterium]MBL0064364.1 hypothetical protein [Bacteroidota bacterium]MBL0139256.1 hypothetical protein [Bacteroidota bacterium]
MKKMLIWMTVIGISLGTVVAQTPSTAVVPTSNPKPAPAAVQKDQQNALVKPHPPAHVSPVVVPNKKPHAKPVHVTPVHTLKKDGTPDRRFHSNKKLKKDGTPDARYKENKTPVPPSGDKK